MQGAADTVASAATHDGMHAFHGKRVKPPKLPEAVAGLRPRMHVAFFSPDAEKYQIVPIAHDGVVTLNIYAVRDCDAFSEAEQEMLLLALEAVKKINPVVLVSLCSGGVNRSCLFKILAQIGAGLDPDPWSGYNSYFSAIVKLAKEHGDIRAALSDAVKPSSTRKRTLGA